MQFSVWPAPSWTFGQVRELALRSEHLGYDGIWFADHFMPHTGTAEAADGPMLECWSVLAALAAEVPRVRLGPLVTSVTYRHPAVLANIAATVDHVSGGRLVLGVGAGWQENEHAAYGIELGGVGERLDRFEEACVVLRGLLDDPRTTVEGAHYRVVGAPCDPKPVQRPLPMLVGGSGERRTMAIAARHADEWNAWSTPELAAHKARVLEQHCDRIGRDPATIRRSTQAVVGIVDEPAQPPQGDRPTIVGTPEQLAEQVAAYAAAGIDEMIIPCFDRYERASATVERFMAEVVPLVG